MYPWQPNEVLYAADLNSAIGPLYSPSTSISVTATGTSASRTLGDRAADVLHASDFGVVANGVTDDSAALAAWWNAVNATGKVGVLPVGTILCNSPITWNIAENRRGGIRIEGPSVQGCVIDVRNAPATADGGAQFLLSCTSGPAFYGVFSNFTIVGNNSSGPAVRLGRSSLVDEFNGFRFSSIEFKNTANAANAIACELNGHFSNDFNAVTTNTGGARAAGTSLRIRRASFCRFFGSFSGAAVGLLVDGTFTFANAFIAVNIEEVTVGVRFAGSSNSRNTFVAGTFIADTCVDFQAGSGAENVMLAPNLSPYSGGVISSGVTGLSVLANSSAAIGNMLSGGLSVTNPVGRAAELNISSQSDQVAVVNLNRNDVLRWRIIREIAEPGSNTGGALYFEAFSDAGAGLGAVAWMERNPLRFNAPRANVSTDLQVPSYTVAGLPSASPASRICFVSNESGGAVLAFSDGTNWRRVTDRAIVT